MVSFYAASVIVAVKCCNIVIFSKFLLFSKENALNLAMVRSSHNQYKDTVYLIKQFDSIYVVVSLILSTLYQESEDEPETVDIPGSTQSPIVIPTANLDLTSSFDNCRNVETTCEESCKCDDNWRQDSLWYSISTRLSFRKCSCLNRGMQRIFVSQLSQNFFDKASKAIFG